MKDFENRLLSKVLPAVGLSSLALLAAGCTTEPKEMPVPRSTQGSEPECEPYTVYAQNRWPATPNTDTYGAAIRPEPSRSKEMIGSFAGNALISVTGWRSSGVPTYPQNPPPFNNDVWFRIDSKRWVSYAGTRGAETEQNPSGTNLDGGKPAELKPECEIK